MPAVFFYFLNILMISRLVFAFHDRPVTRKNLIIMLGVQLAGAAVLQSGWPLLILVLMLGAGAVLLFRAEHRLKPFGRLKTGLYPQRLLWLAVWVLLAGFFFSAWGGLDFNPGLGGFLGRAGAVNLLLASRIGDWPRLHLVLCGVLLVTNEANLLIRLLLRMLQLAPPANTAAAGSDPAVDEREFNAGRVIGILERLLIYIFVLNAQYAAIGFILAAKSFTRFRELEKRTFAEYVLVGTLLSALLAMLGAVLVQQLSGRIIQLP